MLRLYVPQSAIVRDGVQHAGCNVHFFKFISSVAMVEFRSCPSQH